MAGISPLVCRDFSETADFEKSRDELLASTDLTEEDLYDRIEAVEWALVRGDNDDEAWVERVPGLNLWAVVIPGGIPPLRLYIRPCDGIRFKCEWVWVEERP
jgi:hypothetical protein